MDNPENSQRKSIVRVRSIKRNGSRSNHDDEDDEVESQSQVAPGAVGEEEILDPYTIKRRESMKNSVFDIYVKVMLLGDSGVGKTCMLMRFRDGLFLSGNFISTVGVDFRTKVVEVDETKVKLQIWDTAGQERFRSVTHAYYRDAHALLLLYDVTNKNSFDNIRAWLGEIREYAQDDVVIMLLGNKADCGSDRAIRREEGERLAREYNVTFMETSAKSGQNVELAFHAIAKKAVNLAAMRNSPLDQAEFHTYMYKILLNYDKATELLNFLSKSGSKPGRADIEPLPLVELPWNFFTLAHSILNRIHKKQLEYMKLDRPRSCS